MAFNILADPSANIFKTFSADVYKTVREGIIRCILATDMARHNEILNQFNEIVPEFDYNNRAHVNLVSERYLRLALLCKHFCPGHVRPGRALCLGSSDAASSALVSVFPSSPRCTSPCASLPLEIQSRHSYSGRQRALHER